jgi:predicted lipoprotein with Yx(FWY)xxD motif
MSMPRAALLILTLATLSLAACGDSESPDAAAAARSYAAPEREPAAARAKTAERERPAAAARRRRGTTVKVISSQFGRILGDGRGQAFYYFDAERAGDRPRCYGACATAWPPVLAKGRPVAGAGARGGKIGVVRRRNGNRQVTYAGRPLYYYVADSPGQVLCHDVREFGGLWVVIRPDGRQVG